MNETGLIGCAYVIFKELTACELARCLKTCLKIVYLKRKKHKTYLFIYFNKSASLVACFFSDRLQQQELQAMLFCGF